MLGLLLLSSVCGWWGQVDQSEASTFIIYVCGFFQACVCFESLLQQKQHQKSVCVSALTHPCKLQIGPRLSWAQSRHNRAVLRSVEEAERRQQCIPSPWRLDIRGMLLSKRNDSVTQQDQSVDTDCSLDRLLSLCYCVFPVNPCLLSWSCCFYVKINWFWTKD